MNLSDVTINFRNGILTKKMMFPNEKLDVHAYRVYVLIISVPLKWDELNN